MYCLVLQINAYLHVTGQNRLRQRTYTVHNHVRYGYRFAPIVKHPAESRQAGAALSRLPAGRLVGWLACWLMGRLLLCQLPCVVGGMPVCACAAGAMRSFSCLIFERMPPLPLLEAGPCLLLPLRCLAARLFVCFNPLSPFPLLFLSLAPPRHRDRKPRVRWAHFHDVQPAEDMAGVMPGWDEIGLAPEPSHPGMAAVYAREWLAGCWQRLAATVCAPGTGMRGPPCVKRSVGNETAAEVGNAVVVWKGGQARGLGWRDWTRGPG